MYDNRGNYPKALEYYHKALAIREKVLGKEHPDIAQSYFNIGCVLFKKGDIAEAEKYIQKAVDIAQKALGKDHPWTKHFLKNLEFLQKRRKK